jgi:predicted ATPase/DNA-binding CsgD family transcriptional regulator
MGTPTEGRRGMARLRETAPRRPLRRPTNLPAQLSSFVGRDQVVAGLRQLLARDGSAGRLVTLTGTGGTGKTRVALRVASDLHADLEDGVFFVALAPITDPDLVAPTIAHAVGIPDVGERPRLERLIDHLRARRALLVLDNFEQVVDAAPTVAQLLAGCAELRVLVTSRAALRLTGEQEYVIPPLTLPGLRGAALSAAEVAENEAVRLFVERARSVRGDFALTDQNAPAVVELCRRLDGLPLAIELAAVRVRLLDPKAILARLESAAGRLQLLTGGGPDMPARQRTLRDTIAWSHDLLDPHEQALFRRLAVFVGGCTLEAAEAVCGFAAAPADESPTSSIQHPPADQLLSAVESLLAKSLLRAAPAAGEPRVTMLETIREFALERLTGAGELDALRARHLDYFVGLAERAEIGIRGPDECAWLDRLQADQDNLRAALERGLTADRESSLRLGAALWGYWWVRGQSEGLRWLTRALTGVAGRSRWRMKALYAAGHLAHIQHDSAAARRLLEESLAIARERDDTWTIAWTLHLLGRVAYFDDDAEAARALGERSLAAAQDAGDDWLVGWAVHLLGLAAHIAADYATARAHYEHSLAIRERLGQPAPTATIWLLLGMVAFREGDVAGARTQLADSLRVFHELGAHFLLNVALAGVSGLAAQAGRLEAAVCLAAASARLGETHEVRRIPLADDIVAEALALARRGLDRASFDAAWAQGQAMSTAEAVAEALAVDVAPPAASSSPVESAARRPGSPPAGLTPRELRVLRLLASGLTTQQIAGELVVAVSTVERHITHIYAKIGARGRAAATAFALRHGLLSG